jgi:hypothetical protein
MNLWERFQLWRSVKQKRRLKELEADLVQKEELARYLREINREYEKRKPLAKVVSSERIVCREEGEPHEALLLIREDGKVDVRCPGDCSYCRYRR